MAENRAPAWTLTARWVFPGQGPPLPRGSVTVSGDRIVAVEPHGARCPDRDLGAAVVVPGFVNAHTHLDLSGLRGRLPPSPDFPAWLRGVTRHRQGVTAEQVVAEVRAGLAESVACGTTLVGDISSRGLSWPVLQDAPVRAVVFYELLGLPRPRARQAWAEARAWLRTHAATATCRPGLSPHAPYSVRASLFRAAAACARREDVPLAIHLAESAAELDLLQSHSGPFVDFLRDVDVWDPAGLVRGVGQVVHLNRDVRSCLLVHGNYLPPSVEVPEGHTVVYCPRTHAAFGHAPHSLPRLVAAGVRVALGTDSLASNPDLSVLGEARFLHREFPDLPGAVLLRMATLAGAEALGWGQETGRLAPGKSADLVVLAAPDVTCDDPHELLFRAETVVRAVLGRGRWVYPVDGPAP